MQVIIMQGVSGSGKSFHGAQIAREFGAVVVSADTFPGLYGPGGSFNIGLLGAAHGACFKSAIEALQAGESVVVDNTNTTTLEVAPYVQAAQAFGATPRIVRVNCEAGKALARNTHGVPEAGHAGQVARLAAFEPAFHWQFIEGFEIDEIEN